ncbi:Transposon Tf2-6 polyprotein [Gossypium australe]|uniref:Transposon Tf2-6 polyprotein n=1 Tax=Gossypium australe TaxID=47621 RepID=A0A5B6WJ33_9ROSI|nr:Transposon Tf2-6 polyprotein [Gossypium australe]
MLQAEIIRDSNIPFLSPIVMVKKDGSCHLCVDYRKLNQLIIKNRFSIPIIEELLDELGQALFFSKLDLISGDILEKTFKTHKGHYEFFVMPFGLTNIPLSFQPLKNVIFKRILRRSVLVFFDDILVYSSSWTKHLVHLKEVLQLLRDNNIFVKQSKYTFGTHQIEYLGHIISTGTVIMDAAKVEGISNWPIPKSIKELRGFLSLSSYYKRFIRTYGVMAKPLTHLLKKNTPWNWAEIEQTTFELLKQSVCQAPILCLPNFKEELCINTNACGQGLEVALHQKGRLVAFFNKGLGIRHQALSIYDKGLLAVLMAVKKWHTYLVERIFQIRIDYQILKFLADR